jgi:uncharacterized protein YjbJ (UPF0337 family)
MTFAVSVARRFLMSNQSEKSEGVAEQIGGKIKKGIGKLIGDDQMHAEGTATELKGEARVEAAKAAERGKGKVEEVVGSIKNRVAHIVGNEAAAAEGKATERKGEDRQRKNQ